LHSRKKVLRFQSGTEFDEDFTIGIPAALHLFDELDLWQKFFDLLSIKTVSSETMKQAVKTGKKFTGAEFCAPLTALHSHVQYLSDKADYIFLPDYLEVRDRHLTGRRQYCYYTQFAPALISKIDALTNQATILNPTLKTIRGSIHTKLQLYKMMQKLCKRSTSFFRVAVAYDKAVAFHRAKRMQLKEVFRQERSRNEGIDVMLLGRPYTVLSSDMNSKIPEIFAKFGLKTFFQDMLPFDQEEVQGIAPLLKVIHWHYASLILEAAEVTANTHGLYPVLVTSFKCTPDAFVIETFKQILDSRKKPYLILQLDEHDSSVGYETRIEAAIRSFKNHYGSYRESDLQTYRYQNPNFLSGANSLKDKYLILPNFDYLPCKLLEASLRKESIRAYLMEESPDSIRRSMSLNQGQCLPVSMMTQAAIDCIVKNDLDPAKTAIWTIESNISCNLGVIPHSLKNMLRAYGKGMEKVDIYTGEITYLDMSLKITYNAYFAFMFGGLLKKMGCKTRPYELIPGQTDESIRQALDIFYNTFLNDKPKEEAVKLVVALFEKIGIEKRDRPQVAIFGDLYARDNDVVNQNLIGTIERNGGEAITTPYSEYMRMIANPFIRKWIREGLYSNAAAAKVLAKTFPILEKKYYALFNRIIREREHSFLPDPESVLARFGVKMLHTGESLETLLKVFTFIDNYPDIGLFVQTNPSLCCPSLVTEAMAGNIEAATGIPVVTIEYDGTGGIKNDTIIPYLKFPRKRVAAVRSKAL
jgi:predicted nucleotide-binding protein (sugar kinase/HSP70/actin superfamily)